MSTSPIPQTIDILSREKGIEPQVIISAIEDAVVTAARKQFKTGEDLRARYNPETGDVELFALMTVVEEVQDPATEISLADVEEMGVEGAEVGDQLEFPKPREELGRIAAQTAKQIIFQKVREAERNNVYDEYISRVGELVHGFVKRFEGGRIITDLGKIESVLPKTQQSRAESFSQGERIRVVINTVSRDAKGPQVEVSRTSPELLKRLFEMEVPEIYDGTVQIKAAVREPGDRAKIAVISTERDVDPVGACVGMKGSRVQAIIRELRGERIDIIEWSEDPAVFAANALSPAKVSKVEINSFEEKKLTVTVPEDQLSLAIGKKGQNVRLAAKLVGWHIDIRSAEEAARAAAAQLEAVMAGGEATLTDIRESLALDQITAERLKDRGIENIEQLSALSVDELVDAIDVSFDQANEILDRAHRLLAQKHAREARDARDAETTAAPTADEGEAAQTDATEAGSLGDQVSEAASAIAEAGAAVLNLGASLIKDGVEAITGPAEEAPDQAGQAEGGETSEQAPGADFKSEAVRDEGAAPGSADAADGGADEARMAEPEPTAEEAADQKDQERQYAPPPDAEPGPARPGASAGPDFDSMSPSEIQIQEFLADVSPGVEETQGPMPSSAFQALAPGERVVPDTQAEWREEAGIETSDERRVDDLVASFDTPPSGEAGGGDVSPSEADEEETGQEASDELSPGAFEGGSEAGAAEGDPERPADADDRKDQ
ncbi:MAG TPA: transcription termination factor NusA [Blastocatellia bacterium]|jgi:N utilization substance protein A|nr:transcription termination factor NusA [Blastocatellia bacterium]